MADAPTTAQIRQAIDSGLTGEKVGFPDPATAPLGTDAEAAGEAPTARERAIESSGRPYLPPSVPPNGIALYLCGMGAIYFVAIAILLLA